MNTITEALNRLTFTAASHDRVMVVEVMGREAGHLALHSGIAGGADVILIPEITYSIEQVCQHLAQLRNLWGRRFAIVVVAEGAHHNLESPSQPCEKVKCGIGQYVANEITKCSHYPVDCRVSVLGHIQRSGIPSALDRSVATTFGKTAVDLIANGESRKMVAWQNGHVATVELDAVLVKNPCSVDPTCELIKTATALGIYTGSSLTD